MDLMVKVPAGRRLAVTPLNGSAVDPSRWPPPGGGAQRRARRRGKHHGEQGGETSRVIGFDHEQGICCAVNGRKSTALSDVLSRRCLKWRISVDVPGDLREAVASYRGDRTWHRRRHWKTDSRQADGPT
jgi:hypothetical protein